jgi:hypothetical protein
MTVLEIRLQLPTVYLLAQENAHAVYCPYYKHVGTVSLLVYRPDLDENADSATRNAARARSSHGDSSSVVHRP